MYVIFFIWIIDLEVGAQQGIFHCMKCRQTMKYVKNYYFFVRVTLWHIHFQVFHTLKDNFDLGTAALAEKVFMMQAVQLYMYEQGSSSNDIWARVGGCMGDRVLFD